METSAPLLGEPLPVELMNTVWADREGVHDALDSPDGARAWLRAVAARTGFMAGSDADVPSAGEFEEPARRLVGLRDALRRLAAEVTGDTRPTDAHASGAGGLGTAVAELNDVASTVPSWSALAWTAGKTPERRTRTGGTPAAAAVSALAEEAIALFGGEDRLRIRACLAPGCVLYFLKDHTRREWCSTSCGNRARAARHYRRHRGTAE
ncbi:CGNR zinc finger domain-containing protein [Streptomyces fructofermentans]|nr:ABATE domain-containing protein [Streptomyces fructofermentans]